MPEWVAYVIVAIILVGLVAAYRNDKLTWSAIPPITIAAPTGRLGRLLLALAALAILGFLFRDTASKVLSLGWATRISSLFAEFGVWSIVAMVLVAVAGLLYLFGGKTRVAHGFAAAAALLVVFMLAMPAFSLIWPTLPPKAQLVLTNLNWWLLIPLAVIIIVLAAGYRRAAAGLVALLALFLTFYYFGDIPACAPDDKKCLPVKQETRSDTKKQGDTPQQRWREEELRREQANRRVARSAECPGVKRGKIPIPEGVWIRLPSKPGTCGFTISDQPKLEFKNDLRSITVSGDKGLVSSTIPTHARAKPGMGMVAADYMLCPLGMSPTDGSWECLPRSSSVASGMLDVLFGRN